MNPSPFEFKIVVAGPFGVGKTALISSVSNVSIVGTEVPTTGDEADEKSFTTVGLEYGLLAVGTSEFDINLLLYGTPGQQRYRFMWDAVSIGADGFVVLVDATRPDTWDEVADMLSYFIDRHGAKCVVGANRTHEGADALRELSEHLKVDAMVPIVACDVTNEQSARNLMVVLLERIIGDEPPAEDRATGGTSAPVIAASSL